MIWTAHYSTTIIMKCKSNVPIIDNSRNTLLVTDHSKFSRRAMVKLGAITDVEYVFTDSDVPPSIDELLKNKNVNLVVC